MGTPFKMKGSKFYGRGNQSPVSQIGGLPEKVAPVRPAASAPAAPSAAGLDYVNPVEGSSPAGQVAPKTGVRDVDEVTRNKMESYAARAGGPTESGPIEQKRSPAKQGNENMSANELVAIRKKLKAKKEKLANRKKEGKVTLFGNRKRKNNEKKIKKNQELINNNPEAKKWKKDGDKKNNNSETPKDGKFMQTFRKFKRVQ
jgi:hypothetical protein